MTKPIAPDTHTLLWYLTDDPRLSVSADRAMTEADENDGTIVVSVIVLVEALRLFEKGKTAITASELLNQLQVRGNVRIRSVDLKIFRRMLLLNSSLEMHDRIIVATALEYGAMVITKDREIAEATATLW